MYCSHCGKEILLENNYCPYCGASVEHRTMERHNHKNFHLWITLILIGSAIFTTIISVVLVVNNVNFLDKGLRAEAVIINVLRGYQGSDYTLVYEFTNPRTGTQITVVGLGRDWPPHVVGRVVNILYDPSQEYEANRIKEADGMWLAPILITAMSGGIWFSVFVFRKISTVTRRH